MKLSECFRKTPSAFTASALDQPILLTPRYTADHLSVIIAEFAATFPAGLRPDFYAPSTGRPIAIIGRT
eukprot:587067-Pleurochrysis_carterae.AAC.1